MIRRTSVAAIVTLLLVHCAPSSQLNLEQMSSVSNGENHPIAQRANELFHSPDDLVFGNPFAKITVVEFFDYNCGYVSELCQK